MYVVEVNKKAKAVILLPIFVSLFVPYFFNDFNEHVRVNGIFDRRFADVARAFR